MGFIGAYRYRPIRKKAYRSYPDQLKQIISMFFRQNLHINVITYIVKTLMKMNSFVVIPAIISIKVRTSSLFIFKSFFK